MNATAKHLVDLAMTEGYWADLLANRDQFAPNKWAQSRLDAVSLVQRMSDEGYGQIGAALPPGDVRALEKIVDAVHRNGWLPVFAFLGKDIWRLRQAPAVVEALNAVLGPGYRQLPDFWAWRVDTTVHAHGFRPHREIEFDSLREDGSPKSLTVWFPLTDATLDNGCMYLLPMDLELYNTSQRELVAEYGSGNTIGALLHRVRAVPASAGDALLWNHFVLHWGSFTTARAAAPRVSVAMEFIRGDIDGSFHPHAAIPGASGGTLFLDPAAPVPPFAERLRLVAHQIGRYHRPSDATDPFTRFATAVLGESAP